MQELYQQPITQQRHLLQPILGLYQQLHLLQRHAHQLFQNLITILTVIALMLQRHAHQLFQNLITSLTVIALIQ